VSWVKLGRADHNRIRRSKSIQNALADEAAKIAAQANSRAGISAANGYKSDSPVEPNPDLTVGNDRARAHVWASGEAVRAEKQNAYLMGIAGE
jgi:hypothetical protein